MQRHGIKNYLVGAMDVDTGQVGPGAAERSVTNGLGGRPAGVGNKAQSARVGQVVGRKWVPSMALSLRCGSSSLAASAPPQGCPWPSSHPAC